MKNLLTLVTVVLMLAGTSVYANTIDSSTMWFQGTLTQSPTGGGYTGTLAMIDESAVGIGDGIAGFDVYAKNGAMATYDTVGSGGSSYVSGPVADHDAYNGPGGWGSFYNPDCADWNHYQLTLTGTTWALEYVNGGTTYAAPMSGTMNWATWIAAETDTGAYYSGMGTPESDGYAATFASTTGQSTAGAWDMDWSWGSEFVPLQYPDFKVSFVQCGDETYVSLTPVPVPAAMLLGVLGLGTAGLRLRKRS